MKNKQLKKDEEMSDSRLELTAQNVIKYLCPDATVLEATNFVEYCKAKKADPFSKEIFIIKTGKGSVSFVTSKDLFMNRAQANKKFKGLKAGIVLKLANGKIENREGTFYTKDETLVGGWAEVYVANYDAPMFNSVSFTEYAGMFGLWKTKPATMIRKVALVQSLREAFPEDLGGMYDSSEMDADIETAQSVKRNQVANENIAEQEKPQTLSRLDKMIQAFESININKETLLEMLGVQDLNQIDDDTYKLAEDLFKSNRNKPLKKEESENINLEIGEDGLPVPFDNE